VPASAPEWVADWLGKRGAAQQKKQARAEAAAAKPVDEAAQAKRAEKRHDNILAGLDQLDAWMGDLLRQGLARAQAEPPSFWDTQARRLVDAQAPGLASRVRAIGARVGSSGDWTSRVLDDLGALGLLSHAFRRLDRLGAPLAADVRRIVGIALDQAEVVAHGDTVEDDWLVVADVIDDDDRLRTQRAWLCGLASGRSALVLQFAMGTGRFAEVLTTGTKFRATLSYWPSASPQRALVASRSGTTESVTAAPPGDDVAGSIDRYAGRLAELPWLDRDLFLLRGVVPEPGDVPRVLDEKGLSLPLDRGVHDRLLAVGGGHPVTLAGEWNGYAFTPLTIWADGRVVSLARRAI
jgi:hypothetical protein